MRRSLRAAMLATAVHLAALGLAPLGLAAGPAAAQDAAPSAPAAAPAPAAPGATDWILILWKPVADWSAWLVQWTQAEERIVVADVERLAQRLVDDAEAFETLVADAGFSVNSVGVALSPLPAVTLDLDFERRLSAEERTALLARVAAADGAWGVLERRLVDIMLAAADTEYAAERDSGYGLTGLEIEADLIPEATLILGPRSDPQTTALR